ncbi:MAG: diguanylate cyclase [Pseudomonadota bacterium]
MNTSFYNVNAYATDSAIDAPVSEIIVQIDPDGFVVSASSNTAQLGVDLSSMLLMPHVADFAVPDHQAQVKRYVQNVIEGDCGAQVVEFPVIHSDTSECDEGGNQHWYSLELRCLDSDTGGSAGALGVLQSVQHKYEAHEQKPDGVISDPFTGLADRRSFISSLIGSIAINETASVAVFAIDSMRAIFMQYGQGTADEIRWGFARFLEAMTEPQQSLAQIDEERFGVVLPGLSPRQARKWANDTLKVFSGLASPSSGREPELSASAGIARADLGAEWTLRQAELGLVMARAAGGMQAAICKPNSCLSSGHLVEQAMETVVANTRKRAG